MAQNFGSKDERAVVKDHGWPKARTIMSCQSQHGPLLTRYYLTPDWPIAVYLHQFHASDEDRALHDHPYSFITILLSSGYWEHVAETVWAHDSYHGDCPQRYERIARVWRRRFSILFRRAEHKHRVELEKAPTWTMVIRFKKRRMWGFHTKDGWVDWRKYGREMCD